MDLQQLLADHSKRQQKYFKVDQPWQSVDEPKRLALLQSIMSYIVEETVEVNRELHHYYKPFKAENEVNYDKLAEEICPICFMDFKDNQKDLIK